MKNNDHQLVALVIDDALEIRMQVELALQPYGNISIVYAQDGKEALEYIGVMNFDLIIADNRDSNNKEWAVEVTQVARAKSLAANHPVKVILHSGTTTTDHSLQESGALSLFDVILPKPAGIQDIRDAVTEALHGTYPLFLTPEKVAA